MNYEFHPEAEQELYEAAMHYESKVPGLGRRLRDDVERVIKLILEHPELGSRRDVGPRAYRCRRAWLP